MREMSALILLVLGCFLTTFGLIGTGVYFGPAIVAAILKIVPPGVVVIFTLILGVLILGIVYIKEK